MLQHLRFSSKIRSVITGAKWYATKWSHTLWQLSKSSALSSFTPPPVSLKGMDICFDVSHNHFDWSANSALKAIDPPSLAIVTIVSPLWLSSNLPAYLGSALVKIMLISSCCGFRVIFRAPPLHTLHLPPRPSCILWKSLSSSLMTLHCAHCLHLARHVGFCHHPALSLSCWPLHQGPGKSRTGLFRSKLLASCQSERWWLLLLSFLEKYYSNCVWNSPVFSYLASRSAWRCLRWLSFYKWWKTNNIHVDLAALLWGPTLLSTHVPLPPRTLCPLWCERCLFITESPKTPGHYRYLMWVLYYIP